MVRECQGNEDEKGCSYASTDCGDGALDAGTKCYRFVRREGFTTWNEAASNCTEGNERLVTLATRDDFARFRQIIATVKDPRTVNFHRSTAVERNTIDEIQFVISDALYKRVWQWRDGRKTIFSKSFSHSPQCGFYNPLTNTASSDDCDLKRKADVLCEFSKPTIHSVNKTEIYLVSRISIKSVWFSVLPVTWQWIFLFYIFNLHHIKHTSNNGKITIYYIIHACIWPTMTIKYISS